MRRPILTLLAAGLVLAAVPCSAGIHYKSTTKTWSEGTQARNSEGRNSEIEAEGWVAGDKAKVAFVASNGNPVAQQGTYIITKDGGRPSIWSTPRTRPTPSGTSRGCSAWSAR